MSGPGRASPLAETPLEIAVSERVDELTTWRHQLIPPIIIGIAMLFDNFDGVMLAQIVPALLKEWQIGPVVAGTVISVGYAGQFIGSLSIGPFAERFGRMPTLHLMLATMALTALFCAITPSYQILMALRFVQGVAIGAALPVAATYVNELAPTRIRGRYFTIYKFFTDGGYTLAPVIGVFVIPMFGWRGMFVVSAAPLLLIPLIALVLPESPRWLARRGRGADANRALRRLGGRDATLPEISATAAATIEKEPIASPLLLFARPYRRSTIIATLLWLLSSIIIFGIVNWAPVIHVSIYHVSHQKALEYIAMSGIIYTVVAPIIGLISDSVGRRNLGIAISGIAAVCMLILSIGNPANAIIAAILLHTTGKGIGAMGSMILWPYSAETAPTQVRATALGFYAAVNRIPPMVIPIVIGGILSLTGSILPAFALFAACAIGLLILWIFYARETAQRSLEETTQS